MQAALWATINVRKFTVQPSATPVSFGRLDNGVDIVFMHLRDHQVESPMSVRRGGMRCGLDGFSAIVQQCLGYATCAESALLKITLAECVSCFARQIIKTTEIF